MTVLAEWRIVDTDPQPWAWFTMPMLMWALGILAALAVGALAVAVIAVRRLNQHVDAAPVESEPAPLDVETRPDNAMVVGGAVKRDRPSPVSRPTGGTAVFALTEDDWRRKFNLPRLDGA